MAKKTTRRPNLPQETLARARREMYGSADVTPVTVEEPVEVPQKPRRVTGAPRIVRPVDLRQEYAYVLTDLQNMGMLAAVLMILLVVFSFFI